MTELMTIAKLIALIRKNSTSTWGGLVKIGKKASISMDVKGQEVPVGSEGQTRLVFEFHMQYGNPTMNTGAKFVTDVLRTSDLPATIEILTIMAQAVFQGVDKAGKRIQRSVDEHTPAPKAEDEAEMETEDEIEAETEEEEVVADQDYLEAARKKRLEALQVQDETE